MESSRKSGTLRAIHVVVPHDHRRSMAHARRREIRVDARRHGFHVVRDGDRPAAHVLRLRRCDGGMLGTITLVMSGVGGVLFGYLADRLGRTRALMGTILLFSIASLGAATSQSVFQLLLWRALLGIGMGGEWASGAVLISETWPPAHRNKAISIMQSGWAIGYIVAALMAALILGGPAAGPEAWRWLFLVGVLPGAVHAVDPPLRARAGGLGGARAGEPRPQSVLRDFRPGPARPHAADHPARRIRAVRVLGHLLLAAGVSGAPDRAGRRRHGRGRVARLDHSGADWRLFRLSDLRLHRGPARPPPDVHPVHAGRRDSSCRSTGRWRATR